MSITTIEIVQFPDGRFDSENAGLYLGLSVKTLAMLRNNGNGPLFIKCGRIFYYKKDLDDWLLSSGKLSINPKFGVKRKPTTQKPT